MSDVTIITDPKLSIRFKQLCAVTFDGTYYLAKGYVQDIKLFNEILTLKNKNILPKQIKEVICEIEDVANFYQNARSPEITTDKIRARVQDLLEISARAKASDFIIYSCQGTCHFYALVNDKRIEICDPWTSSEGELAMEQIFYAKDEGSKETSYKKTDTQGFSLSPSDDLTLPKNVTKLRAQRGPNHNGFHMVLRLFYVNTAQDTTLENLGFEPEICEIFKKIQLALSGAVFIAGSTGDGKSTTIATNLKQQIEAFNGELQVVTVEDPVEYEIPGAIQIPVSSAANESEREATYTKALMHFCRIHPATGMVSEIRDGNAGRQVMDMVDTGHQVWTTIHCNSANGILFRLIDMQINASKLSKPGNIALLMKQTLVPVLCPGCSIKASDEIDTLPLWIRKALGQSNLVRLRNPKGCQKCHRPDANEISNKVWNGYLRQIAVAEYIEPNNGYLKFVRDHDPIGAQDYWLNEMGGITLHTKVSKRIHAGTIDPRDAIRKGIIIEPLHHANSPEVVSLISHPSGDLDVEKESNS